MPQYNYETGLMEETPEERKAREEAEKRAGTTVVGETKIKQYQDGSQTETVTKEVPAPSFGDRLGQAFTRAGENFVNNVTSAPDRFVNNLNRGIDNVRNAPDRFMQNVSGAPGQMQQRLAPVAPSGFQGQTDEFGGVDQAIARQAQQPAPVAPVAPVAPGSTFDRMIQVESGGRQTDAQGRVLTSPKGALGIAQVMPTTAMDPGYGVKNIFDLAQERGIPVQNRDLATAKQLLGNRALNQEFGANYAKAMENRFDGGPAAVAAYNAGPGRVSQNMARNQGQLNVAQLPQETQGYLQKVGMPTPAQPVKPGVPGLTPVAEMPAPAPAPAPAPNSYDEFGTPVFSQAQANLDTQINRYQSIQNKPDELMKFAFDDTAPDFLKQRAKDQLVQGYDSQKKESQAQSTLATMNQNEIARAMTKKSEGNSVGDWVQYLLFRHVGLTDLANQKGEQLGIGHKWTQSTIPDDAGNDLAIEIQTTASGRVLGGNRLDGTPLTAKELNLAGGSIGNKDYDIVGGTFVSDNLKDKNGNALVGTVYRSKTNPNKQFVQTDEGRKPLAGFRPQSTSGSLEQQGTSQLQKLRNDLQFKGPEAAAKALGEFDAMNGTRYLEQYKQNAPQFFQTIGMTPPGQQAAGTTTGGGAPAQAAGTTTTPAPITTGSPADITSGRKVSEAEKVQFVEKVLPEINKKGDDGRYVADTRRTQVSMLTGPNSAIMGIYRGSGTEYEKARSVLRDAIAGAYSGRENAEKFSEAIRGISIPAPEMSALKEFAQLNTGINSKTLAENAGEGPKSDADIKLNQQANMTNIGDLPAFAALTGLTRSQFAGDVNKRKQDFVLANRDKYQTQSQVEQAWSKEKDTLNRQYEGIYRERLNFIDGKMVEKFGKDWRKRPDSETQGFYRDASIHSFNVLPTPNYDVQTQKFVYPTQQSKVAAMRAVTGR